jgi:hypothetical protein
MRGVQLQIALLGHGSFKPGDIWTGLVPICMNKRVSNHIVWVESLLTAEQEV